MLKWNTMVRFYKYSVSEAEFVGKDNDLHSYSFMLNLAVIQLNHHRR